MTTARMGTATTRPTTPSSVPITRTLVMVSTGGSETWRSITSVLVMGTLLGVVGLVVAVPILAVVIVVIRHVLQGEIYGDDTHYEPAVLRTTAEFRAPREKLPV